MKNKKEMMLKAPMVKVVLMMALPVMMSNLMQTLYNLADTYWVGQYEMMNGFEGEMLSAIILIFPAIGMLLALGTGISTACISLISQYIGSGNEDHAKKVAAQALSFSFISSLILGIIGAIFTPLIVKLLGAEGAVLENGIIYLRLMMFGLPTVFLFFTFNAIKQSQGDTFSPMLFSILSVTLNIILDPILMIVFDMGIAGAAIATIFSRGLFIVFAIGSLFKESKRHMKLDYHDLKLDMIVIKQIFQIGLPASISSVMSSFGFGVLNNFVIGFGVPTLTAFGIGNRITGLILMPAMGIGSALGAIVGTNLGAENVPRAKSAVKVSFLLSSGILVAGGAIIFVLAEPIILQFNNVPEVVSQATVYLKLIIATIPLMAAFSVLNGTFIGSGHTGLSLFISAGRLWLLRIPLIVIFKNFTNLGTNSVWYAMILSNLIICLIGYAIYKTGTWETKIVKEPRVKVA
ncbi:MATE family efflux transporter [Acidaminobacter sp. JC074]|uniref:MATE family efflux transporter n=1 Tax=Acidaminobacter sp. JC074 TaxID=2530199 RepID=UPI001F0D651C|nr:MATE family efflux transporter [Acidaminobacter sp. JC074]MCH4889916.1 MATE family efflux transporter [Acidaminobacter sp. JC074]